MGPALSSFVLALEYFKKAVFLAEESNYQPVVWEPTFANIGHAYRKLGYDAPSHFSSWFNTASNNDLTDPLRCFTGNMNMPAATLKKFCSCLLNHQADTARLPTFTTCKEIYRKPSQGTIKH
jgi:hypothetical protein